MPGNSNSGRRPKTNREKQLIGSHNRDRSRDFEPPPCAEFEKMPEPPARLRQEARDWWEALAPMLWNNGTLHPLHSGALATLCRAKADLEGFENLLSEDFNKRFIPKRDSDGNVISIDISPVQKQVDKIRDQVTKMEREFGLTPASCDNVRAARPASKGKPIKSITS